MKYRIGIPRALHHKYHIFWEEFLRSLGQKVIVSPETNRGKTILKAFRDMLTMKKTS